jgi:hypothetical protein
VVPVGGCGAAAVEGRGMTETLLIYRCPDCGKVMEGSKLGPRFCAGNQWGMEEPLEPKKGAHPSVEMERLRVGVVGPA